MACSRFALSLLVCLALGTIVASAARERQLDLLEPVDHDVGHFAHEHVPEAGHVNKRTLTVFPEYKCNNTDYNLCSNPRPNGKPQPVCCPQAFACCVNATQIAAACAPLDGQCCSDGHSCTSGQVCCGTKCMPQYSRCCDSRSYCREGYACTDEDYCVSSASGLTTAAWCVAVTAVLSALLL